MACAPHYCNSHSTGTASCAGHRLPCPTNRQASVDNLSAGFGVIGGAVLASDIESLRANIRDELAAWDVRYPGRIYYQASAYIAGSTPIQAAHVTELDNMTGQRSDADVYTPPSDGDYSAPGAEILDDHWWAGVADSLKERYNLMRSNCICNTDCSCNAICACYGDCGCNYSDKQLKQEIIYW